ncbi:MAG: YceI family protein, partial [Bacteroidota bacterium]
MNLKKLFALLPILGLSYLAIAQGPLITKDSETSFFSSAPLEDIKAINKQTTAAIDIAKGEIVVKMLIKHFEFEKKLM